MVWYGMVWYGMVWYGMVWYGMYVCMHVCMYVCLYACNNECIQEACANTTHTYYIEGTLFTQEKPHKTKNTNTRTQNTQNHHQHQHQHQHHQQQQQQPQPQQQQKLRAFWGVNQKEFHLQMFTKLLTEKGCRFTNDLVGRRHLTSPITLIRNSSSRINTDMFTVSFYSGHAPNFSSPGLVLCREPLASSSSWVGELLAIIRYKTANVINFLSLSVLMFVSIQN